MNILSIVLIVLVWVAVIFVPYYLNKLFGEYGSMRGNDMITLSKKHPLIAVFANWFIGIIIIGIIVAAISLMGIIIAGMIKISMIIYSTIGF
jgi:ferric iron reductase protein FhuF